MPKLLCNNLANVIKPWLIFSMLFWCGTTHAQLTSNVFDERVDDSLYLNRLPSKWSLRTFMVLKHQAFAVGSRTTSNAYGYSPNKTNEIGLGFSFYGLNLDLGFYSFKHYPQNDRENESKAFKFVSSLYAKAHLFEAGLYKINGYFGAINEAGGGVFFEKDIPIAFRSDISLTSLTMTYNYLFNSGKITFGSMTGLEMQKRSAGGPMSGFYMGILDMHADSLLIPPGYESKFDSLANISDAFMLTAGINAGYAYTFVLPKHFFVTLSFTPGISLTRSELKSGYGWYVGGKPANLSYKLLTRAAAGYSGPKFYTVVSLLNDTYLMNISDQNYFVEKISKYKMVVGYRL